MYPWHDPHTRPSLPRLTLTSGPEYSALTLSIYHPRLRDRKAALANFRPGRHPPVDYGPGGRTLAPHNRVGLAQCFSLALWGNS